MRTTALDIMQQQFRRRLRGYDRHEVHAFLDLVASEFETLFKENNRLRDEKRRLVSLLEEYRERERTIKNTMLTAQRVMDEIAVNARKEAEIIIAQAELDAHKLLEKAHGRLEAVVDDIRQAKQQRTRAMSELRSLLSGHLDLLETVEEADEAAFEDAVAFLPR
jgi:cell division initiation protein